MKNKIVLVIVCLFGGLFVYDYYRFHDNKLHIVFCNVGQGDAVFIRTPSGKNILYDGGPDKSVLTCLAEHMPFWERTLDIIFLSHPHDDHFSGIYYVIDRYTAFRFDTISLDNKTVGFQTFLEKMKEEHIPQRQIFAGDRYAIGDVVIRVLGPTKTYLQKTSPNGQIGESKEFASAVLQISHGEFDVLLTGDSQVIGLEDALGRRVGMGEVEVLQVPHHGSRFGLDKDIVEQLDPKLAVISVGKNNYGHPSKEILEILGDRNIKMLRTNQVGDIEIVSDGEKWWVKY